MLIILERVHYTFLPANDDETNAYSRIPSRPTALLILYITCVYAKEALYIFQQDSKKSRIRKQPGANDSIVMVNQLESLCSRMLEQRWRSVHSPLRMYE